MKVNKFLLPLLIFILLFSVSSLAYMPDTHVKLVKEACKDYPLNPCCKHIDACINGVIDVDFSVVYYFESNGLRYGITHAMDYCKQLTRNAITEEEQAFAYGSCMHLMMDTVSHNRMVPEAISRTLLPNSIIHIFVEEKMNDWVRSKDPTIAGVTANALNYKPYLPLMQDVLNTRSAYSGVNLDANIQKLQNQIITANTDPESTIGYSPAWESKFNIPITTLIAVIILTIIVGAMAIRMILLKKKNVMGWIFMVILIGLSALLITAFIGFTLADFGFGLFQTISTPFTAITPAGDLSGYYSTSLQNTKSFLANFDSADAIIQQFGVADGFNRIELAERTPNLLWMIFFGMFGFLVLWFAFLHFTKRRNFWSFFQRRK